MARCGVGTAGGSRTSTRTWATSGRSFVEEQVGPGAAPAFATLADVVQAVPASRVAAHDLLDTDPEARVRHARGQSLPDLLDLRFGRLDAVPDAVARPAHRSEVRAILDLAAGHGRPARSRTAAARASSAASTPGRRPTRSSPSTWRGSPA